MPFFVYGTLLPGQPNAHLWQGDDVVVAKAFFRDGRLFDMGGYPMLVVGGGEIVEGYIINVPDGRYHLVMARLDRLEGYDASTPKSPGYRRQIQQIETADGDIHKGWVYVGQENLVNGRPQVDRGDWLAYIVRQTAQGRSWWADVSTIYGLHGSKK